MKVSINILKELAKDLRINHVKHSFLSEETSSKEKFKNIIHDDVGDQSSRTIFIIGAGASTNVSPNVFPPGAIAIDLIEKFFDIKSWPSEIKEKSKKVQELINLPKIDDSEDFETRLFSLSHFLQASDVQEAIEYMYHYKTFPNLFYEILAHLLKNRYIDGVINFNFDELLDQTVEEEVGMGQLHKVLSDGDCIDYRDMLVDNRLRVPFYIKPHGTASHKSSLLFTKEHYVNLSSDLESLLEEIIAGQPLKGDKLPKQFHKLNIITAGFQMESIEFNKMMRRALKKLNEDKISVNLIYLSYSNNSEEVSNRLEKDFGEWCEIKIAFLRDFKVSKNRSTGITPYLDGRYLDHFGLCLIDEITCNFKDEYRPGDINRHIGLISFFQKQILDIKNLKLYNFFSKDKQSDFLEMKRKMFFMTKEYYLIRTIFEIINVILKNNGFIQPKESLKKINRVGIYFDLYVKSHRTEFLYRKSDNAKERFSTELSFYDILKALSLKSEIGKNSKEIFKRKKFNKSKNTFESVMRKWIKDAEKTLINKKKTDFYKKHRHQKELLALCIDCLWQFKFSFEKIYSISNINDERVESQNAGDSLLSSESINLYPNYNDIQLNTISKLDSKNIIPTNLSLTYRYKSMFINEHSNWNRLHVVSDSGLAMLKALRDAKLMNVEFFSKKTIYVVLSDIRLKKQLLKAAREVGNVDIKIFFTAYYDHSRHMALFTSNELSNVKSISYYKKGFSNNVNAIFLRGESNKDNINMLFHTFKQYLAKAMLFSYGTEQSGFLNLNYLPHFEKSKQIDKVISKNFCKILSEDDIIHLTTFNTKKMAP